GVWWLEQKLYGKNKFNPSPAQALGQVADQMAIQVMNEVLTDQQVDLIIRESVAIGLGKTSLVTEQNGLYVVLHNKDDSEDVRLSVARSLGKIGGQQALEALLIVLRDLDDK